MLKNLGLLAFAALLCAVIAPSASANAIYTYTGQPFTVFSGGYACPSVCSITGSFTVAQPFAANLPLTGFNPLSFTFNGGAFTITQASAGSFPFPPFFIVSTDNTGGIQNWLITIIASNPLNVLSTVKDTTFPEDITCVLYQNFCQAPSPYAYNTFAAGTWTTTVTPEPGSILLFSTGLLGLAGAVRRKLIG